MIRIILLSLLVLGSALFSACDHATAPTPVAEVKQPQCSTGNGGVTICVDGNGNVITINPNPTPTPIATPSTPSCFKVEPFFQENVVQAARGVTAQTMGPYITALTTALKAAGFLVTSGGLLPADEIAVKTSAQATFSETYDVWRADNTPQVLYQETCNPARF